MHHAAVFDMQIQIKLILITIWSNTGIANTEVALLIDYEPVVVYC